MLTTTSGSTLFDLNVFAVPDRPKRGSHLVGMGQPDGLEPHSGLLGVLEILRCNGSRVLVAPTGRRPVGVKEHLERATIDRRNDVLGHNDQSSPGAAT